MREGAALTGTGIAAPPARECAGLRHCAGPAAPVEEVRSRAAGGGSGTRALGQVLGAQPCAALGGGLTTTHLRV